MASRAKPVWFTALTIWVTTGMPANMPSLSVEDSSESRMPFSPFLCLTARGAQHQVRKIQVPRVRRHIGALGHVADVAQVTLVDHLPVVLVRDTVHLQGRALVDQVKQGGKGAAQAHAATATVADVEHPLHFLEQGGVVVELGILPVQRMPGGCV